MNSPVDPLLGVILEDRYRIDATIARGGMSAVYVGTDLRLGRRVAVKVMDPRYSGDPQFLRRLEFEARAVASLKHPGLVAVYDQSVEGEIAFLVMELVVGGSLRELLRERGPMPPHAVTAVFDPLLGGLGTAHDAGLVHRDVKPENILIADSGEVKVADFGLVRAVAEAGVTSASVILGTAAYLSPEQVETGDADARSDVYSSGVMMFELLTGRTPFRGDTQLALAYQRLTYDVPSPGDVIAGVPPAFDEIVLTATERNPVNRFDDGHEMRAALLQAAADLGLPEFTVPAPRRATERLSAAASQPSPQRDPAPRDPVPRDRRPGGGTTRAGGPHPSGPPGRDPYGPDSYGPDSYGPASSGADRYGTPPHDPDRADERYRDAPDRPTDLPADEGGRRWVAAVWLLLVVLVAAGLAAAGYQLGAGLI